MKTDAEQRLIDAINAAKARGDNAEALRIAKRLAKLEYELDRIGSGNHTEAYGRPTRAVSDMFPRPQFDDFGDESEP